MRQNSEEIHNVYKLSETWSGTSSKNWIREMLVFPALQTRFLDHTRSDEEELYVGANALHGAAGRERYTGGGS